MTGFSSSDNQTITLAQDFNQSVVSIGSHPDNDISLTGPGVLPFHATVVLENGQYRLIALEPGSDIRVDGTPLDAVSVVLRGSQQVEIGQHMLYFQSNGSPGSMHVTVYQTGDMGDAGQPLIVGSDSAILVNVITGASEIDVEQDAVFEFEVINAGPIVASFFVNVRGVPAKWVDITPKAINLNEGQRRLVQVRVTPPREAASTAGLHQIKIIVTSPNYGGHRGLADLSLTLRPFYEFTLGALAPRDQRIPWRKRTGLTYLPITNQSNSPADFTLMAMDDENGCSFDFWISEDLQLNRQAATRLQAGESVEMPIQITPFKNPMFAMRSKRFHYTTTVQIPMNMSAPQMVSGSAIRVPLFGWWSIMLGLATLLLALFFILQPTIRSFDVAAGKDVIELGDSTKLVWDVSPFATRLSISNIDTPINRGQVSQTVAPAQSTNYELVSGNWLSGMFGIDRKQTVAVLVVPPTPKVNVFEVDKTTVAKGTPVNVRWSVLEADEALLTIDGVVYTLSKEEFSGEQQVVLEKDALITLEAKNASGSELQSYFVNVIPPYINIRAFTVWVRPDGAAMNPGDATVARPITVAPRLKLKPVPVAEMSPDPNFPVKFVELVPEPTSETGYRVEFSGAVRDELQPGEQIILEWDVDGVDSLQIAPFTDELPARGNQPFFPQESMNFVMTAQSGELQGIFMLPVKVFDGEPPKAPTIEFFKASPASMKGAGEVEFSWSVSGEWTRVNLSNADGIIADYLNPVGFKKLSIKESSTVILTAYNGTLSSAKDVQLTVDPALIPPGLVIKSISPDTGRSMVGGQIIVTIDFESIPDGSPYPTGEITVTDGSAICPIKLPAVTCTLTFTTSGLKTISASFPGDSIYLQSSSPDYPLQVAVASAQVDLLPSFYFIGGTTPVAVESTDFELDKGMRVLVEVRPINTVIADENGNISVSICDQDINDQIEESTCAFVASGQVKQATTTANGKITGNWYADITIRNFNTTGLHGMLFEYSHLKNAIDPTSIFQPNINIKRAQLLFSYAQCDDKFTLSGCTYGLTDSSSSEIIFDLYIPGSPSSVLLTSLLPAPPTAAFEITSNPSTTSGGAPIVWDCAVKTVSGTHKLVCQVTGLETSTAYTVSYGYNNDYPIILPDLSEIENHYYMGGNPEVSFTPGTFTLQVLASTKTVIGNLNGVSVGDKIRLTGPSSGIVSILDGQNNRIFPSTGLTLTEKSGADIFGVINEGENCRRNEDGSQVIVTAVNVDCFIYFKHTGNYTLVAAFEGDSTTYNGSTSGDTLVAVQKQDAISGTINYLDGATGVYKSLQANLPAFITDVTYQIQVVLDGPDSAFSDVPGFPPSALVNRKVLVRLWGVTTCSITLEDELVSQPDPNEDVYEVTVTKYLFDIKDENNYLIVAGFDLQCSTPDSTGLSFAVTFSDKTDPIKDSDDFAFDAPVQIINKVITEPSRGSLTVTFKRRDTNTTNMIVGGGTGINNAHIRELHFGQIYDVNMQAQPTDISYRYSTYTQYVYLCPLGISCYLYSSSSSTQPDPRPELYSKYSTGANWSVDPSNLLDGTDVVVTQDSTCKSDGSMALTTTQSSTAYLDYYSNSYQYWDSVYLVKVFYYRITTYGTLRLTLQTSQSCTLKFDSTGDTNPDTAIGVSGAILVDAVSGDGRFEVHNTYTADGGIDKQDVSMDFDPNTGPITGYVNVPLNLGVILRSTDITGGTPLRFATTWSGSFSPTIDAACLAGLGSTGTVSAFSPPTPQAITQTFTATRTFNSSNLPSTCSNSLAYVGNRYFHSLTSQPQPAMTFNKSNPTVTITAPTNGSTFSLGGTITFTATVTGAAGAAADGTVTFKDASDNTICSANLATTNSCSPGSPLSAGSYAVTAYYGGNATYNTGQSTAVTITVQRATPGIVLTSNITTPPNIDPGTSVTFTATLSGTTGFNLTGTVAFKDGGTNITGCGSQAVALVTGTTYRATCTTTSLTTSGAHNITANFTSTSTNYNNAGPSNTVTITVK